MSGARRGSDGALRIILLGYIVRGPLAGLAWHHLQYVLGLATLGHDVYFLEEGDDYPSCYDPTTDSTSFDPGYGLGFAARAFQHLGIGERWAYHDVHAGCWKGPCAERVLDLCASADLLIDVSGVNEIRPWVGAIPIRVLIDTDPAFTQIRHLTDDAARTRASLHNRFFSFGENIGLSDCSVPDDGLSWQPTRQPVALDLWPPHTPPSEPRFTTVMQWDSYQTLRFDGVEYGMKSMSFEPFLDLPHRVEGRLELALGAPEEVRQRLRRHGWTVRDARVPTRALPSYQRYIACSSGELSVAKHGYVVSRSGWFSERTACYLASGRPAIVQDTGFSTWLQPGPGVVAYRTAHEAAAAVEWVLRRYHEHCDAAREIAAAHFDHRTVLASLLGRALHPAAESSAQRASARR